jgi:GxxExxY protein
MATKLLYKDETYKIRGACFRVWKEFGGAFKESIVEKALVAELRDLGFSLKNQEKIPVYYKTVKVGVYIPDLIVNDAILIELKSKPFITREDQRQFWLYLKATSYKLGLLINFGPDKLTIMRRIYDDARPVVPLSSASLSP